MKAKTKQPKIKKGYTFTGWATFNWGICHHRVYRTREEAKRSCFIKEAGETWNDAKNYMRVEKVKCTII